MDFPRLNQSSKLKLDNSQLLSTGLWQQTDQSTTSLPVLNV